MKVAGTESCAARLAAQSAVLKARDKRIIFAPSDFRELSRRPGDRQNILEHANGLVDAVLKVEATLQDRWSISATFAAIAFRPFTPTDMTGISSQGSLKFILGSAEFNDFFYASPEGMAAHEMGHYLSYFDHQGMNRHAWRQTADTLKEFQDDLRLLMRQGHLNSIYFDPIPFTPFIPLMDGRSPAENFNLYECLQELLADKAASQISGEAAVRKTRRPGLRIWRKMDAPWLNVRLFTQARKFGLHWYTLNRLYKIIRGETAEWGNVYTTGELLEHLSNFFDEVSLKHQIPARI